MPKPLIQTTGRRKEAVARVRLRLLAMELGFDGLDGPSPDEAVHVSEVLFVEDLTRERLARAMHRVSSGLGVVYETVEEERGTLGDSPLPEPLPSSSLN